MRIAQIAPIIESVPPEKYGGTERVISALTEELVKRGHEVTLFASGDSITKAHLSSVYPVSLRKAEIENIYGYNIWSLLHVGVAYQRQEEFDIIHDHNAQNNPVSLPLANISRTPVVMTLHGPLNGDYGYETDGHGYRFFELYNKPHLVTISHKQQLPAPHLNFAGNVYHGLPMNHYPFSEKDDGYLLFVGRIHVYKGVEEKGLSNAIEIATRLDMPLLIAAKLDTSIKEDVEYFNTMIQPHLSEKIRFLGEVDEEKRNQLMSRAYCLIHSINFEEPFGLTLIEAMGCGCPVVAFNKGSIPEIIVDGKTGFVVSGIDEAVAVIPRVADLSRGYAKDYVLQNFSASRMAEDYEMIYQKILAKNQAKFVTTSFRPSLPVKKEAHTDNSHSTVQ
jgi:glycosyltransferase involved in cell wall biosynthesis